MRLLGINLFKPNLAKYGVQIGKTAANGNRVFLKLQNSEHILTGLDKNNKVIAAVNKLFRRIDGFETEHITKNLRNGKMYEFIKTYTDPTKARYIVLSKLIQYKKIGKPQTLEKSMMSVDKLAKECTVIK